MENIEKELENYNLIENKPIVLIRESADNKVFSVGQNNKKILRISKRLPVEDVKFEYEAIQYLSEKGIAVPNWIKTKNNNFYITIGGNIAVMFDFLDGYNVNHLPTQIQAHNAGKGLGLMSNVAPGFKTTSPRKRNIFSELERAIRLSDIFIDQFEGGKEFIDQIEEAIEFAKNQKEIEGLIHNDYRPGNVFFDNNNKVIGIIDFDWSCMGPIVKDLALAIVEWSFLDGMNKPDFNLFDSFLEGYNSVAIHKWAKDKKLYSWIKFATLSDAATYFCDLAGDTGSTKKITGSYMYQKYLFFSKL